MEEKRNNQWGGGWGGGPIDSGIKQEDEIPVLKNHFSYEGLLDNLDYCETIKDDSSKWESVDAFNERLYEEFPWLR